MYGTRYMGKVYRSYPARFCIPILSAYVIFLFCQITISCTNLSVIDRPCDSLSTPPPAESLNIYICTDIGQILY